MTSTRLEPGRGRAVAEMSAAMVISGTIGWFVVRSGQPLADLIFWRCVFGGATLLAVCAAMGMLRGHWSRRVLLLAGLGGAAIVVNWLLIFGSFAHAPISVATAVYNTQPFMLTALGVLLFKEKLSADKLAWLAIAFGGVLLIAQGKAGGAAGPQANYLLGIAMALGAAFFYAIAAAATKKLKGTPPHLVALVQTGVGTLMLAPFAQLATLPTGAGTWLTLATMGVVYTGLVYILLYGAIQKLPTSLSGALSFIYPVVAIAVDYIAFDRRLDAAQLAGAAAILLAAAGMTLGWSPRGLIRKPA
jgi:drug/metabolite transporter (DMT)-like permease